MTTRLLPKGPRSIVDEQKVLELVGSVEHGDSASSNKVEIHDDNNEQEDHALPSE